MFADVVPVVGVIKPLMTVFFVVGLGHCDDVRSASSVLLIYEYLQVVRGVFDHVVTPNQALVFCERDEVKWNLVGYEPSQRVSLGCVVALRGT